MKRRLVLAMVAATTLGAGCLDDGDTGDDDGGDTGDADDGDTGDTEEKSGENVAYDRCERRIVLFSELPEPARDEAEIALEHGTYETDGRVVLADVMNVADAYVRYDWDYYAVELTEDDELTLVELVESLPEADEPRVINRTDGDREINLRIEHEGSPLVEASFVLAPDEEATVDGDFRLGAYRAEVDADDVSDSTEWSIDESTFGTDLVVSDDGVWPSQSVADVDVCSWDEDGRLVSGF